MRLEQTFVKPAPGEAAAHVALAVVGDPALGYVATLFKRQAVDEHSCMKSAERMSVNARGNPCISPDHPSDTALAAGARVGLRAVPMPANVMHQTGCTHDLTFLPVADHHYRVTMIWTDGSCDAELSEQSGDTLVAVPDSAKEHKGC